MGHGETFDADWEFEMSKRLVLPILTATALLALSAAAKADMASPTVLANTCFSCHGNEGNSVGAMPSIKGKPAQYISAMLEAFRSGAKKGTVMNRIAKGFTSEEIQTLSKYFAGKK